MDNHPETMWLEPMEVTPPPEFFQAVGGHPLVAQTLYRRGIREIETARAFLNPDLYHETPAIELPGVQAAVERIWAGLQSGEKFLVWGDFDVDGQTSTSLLVDMLRELGGNVTFHIPIRSKESHGISVETLTCLVAENGKPDILLTCDTGVSAHEALNAAAVFGIDVLVTDHHELPDELPPALAIINPKLLPSGHKLSELPGVGVAYKLAQAVYARAGKPAGADRYLDLVALGIVADLAMLHGDTRYLLQVGLEHLRKSDRIGLQAIFNLLEISPERLTEEHVGFAIAPRLNALGRLSDANPIVELLITQDAARARLLALDLEGFNARRKLLTAQVLQGALAQIDRDPGLLEYQALVLGHPEWPAGVIGIVASTLVERFNKPTILFSTPTGEKARGSARSLPGVNITAAIAQQKHLLIQFGGHPMAAGMAIETELIPEFRKELSRTLGSLGTLPAPSQPIDGYLELSELSLELVSELERLAPFGPGYPSLTLASRNLRLLNYSLMGREEEHVLLNVADQEGQEQRVVWWRGAGWPLPEGPFDLAYSVRATTYRGQKEMQLVWIDFRPAQLQEGEQVENAARLVSDFRSVPHAIGLLKQMVSKERVLVWAEAEATRWLTTESVHAVDRTGLVPAPVLAIWTSPPSRTELLEALEIVKPTRILVFGIAPAAEHPGAVMNRLMGLVKYSLNAHQGVLDIPRLAAACGQSTSTIRKGLAYLADRGILAITDETGNQMSVSLLEHSQPANRASLHSHDLEAMIEETRAYRAYFLRAVSLDL